MIEKIPLSLVAILWFLSCSGLRADGGAIRLSERRGGYRISAFTSPTPPRAGLVDISVFVQDAATGEPIGERAIEVCARPRAHPQDAIRLSATTAAATNKLFQAAVFDLPESGWWDVTFHIDGQGGSVDVSFEMLLDDPLPQWWEIMPWIAWPIVPILLFLFYAWRQRGERKKRTSSHG